MRIAHVHCHVDKFSMGTSKNKDMLVHLRKQSRILAGKNVKGI